MAGTVRPDRQVAASRAPLGTAARTAVPLTRPAVVVRQPSAMAADDEGFQTTGGAPAAQTRDPFGSRPGHDFGSVRVHTDAPTTDSTHSRNTPARSVTGRISAEATVDIPRVSGPRLMRQPAATATSGRPCPFPSDFASENEAGLNMMCITDASMKQPPACTLTAAHLALVNAAKADASERVSKTRRRMSWVGGPEFAHRVALRVFTDAPPSPASLKGILDQMAGILGGGALQFAGATCGDPECESPGSHAAAYEAGLGQPVRLCPRAFLPSYQPELRRTVIHEVVHLAGIDIDPNVVERYCMSPGRCDTPCQSTKVADAWSTFIDCVGGPLADAKPGNEPAASGAAGRP
jgi:hypothetical protein